MSILIPVIPREKPEEVSVEDPHYARANELAVQLKGALDEVGDVTTQVYAAQSAAESAAEDAAYTRGQLDAINSSIESVSAEASAKVDDGYVEDGSLYLTANGEVVAGPFTGFGGNGSGGGSSGNNAV